MYKDIIKYAAILMLVTLTASGLLAVVNQFTKPKIEIQKENELQKGLADVLPGSSQGVILKIQKNDTLYFEGYSKPDTTGMIGYAFVAKGKGFNEVIQTIVGIDTTGRIIKINIFDQTESPGYGDECQKIRYKETEPWWQVQFQKKRVTQLTLDESANRIVSITGATITSKAIIDAIVKESLMLQEKIGYLETDDVNTQ